jgi:DNA-binding MarR family transcriptional regulator
MQILSNGEQTILINLYLKNNLTIKNNYNYILMRKLVQKKMIFVSFNNHDKRKNVYKLTISGKIMASQLYDIKTGVQHDRPVIIISE